MYMGWGDSLRAVDTVERDLSTEDEARYKELETRKREWAIESGL